MSLNSGSLNSHPINGSAFSIHFTGRLSDEQVVGIEQTLLATGEVISVKLTQRVYDTGVVSVGLSQAITETIYSVSVGLKQELYGGGVISVGLMQPLYHKTNGTGFTPAGTPIPAGLNSSPDEPSYWSAQVVLKGVDVSVNLTGVASIDNEEGAASVCTFTLKPTAGVVDLTQWVRAEVLFYYLKTDANSNPLVRYLLFNGFVDVPDYDVTSRLTTFTCTDELQRAFEGLTTAQIDAAVGGFWSKEVFDEDADKWSYAQDRMSTIPYYLDYDINRSLVKTEWAAKSTPDFTLNEAVIKDNSISVSLANSREIINQVDITAAYQYESYKARRVSYTWKMFPTVESGNFSPYGWKPVLNSMILQAAEEDSWVFYEKPHFTPWPPSGWYRGVVVINAAAPAVVGATFTLLKRYQQSVSDNQVVILKAEKSVQSLGVLKDTADYAVSATYSEDAEDFEKTEELTGSYKAELNTTVSASVSASGLTSFNSIGEADVDFKYNAYVNSFSERDISGEVEYDLSSTLVDNPRSAFESVLQVTQNLHKTNILKSHRGNSVSLTTVIEPNITRQSTVRVETDTVVAQGKVRQVQHVFDVSSGTAVTNIVLGVSRSTSVGVVDVDTPLNSSTIAPEVLLPPTESNSVFANRVRLGNYVQRIPNSSPIGVNAFGMQAYYDSTEFMINFPEISTENAETLEVSTTSEFIVEVPNEELTLNA